jgi:hypothetical protein
MWSKKLVLLVFISFLGFYIVNSSAEAKTSSKDYRAKELKYQYNVLKEDAKKQRDKQVFELIPSGYMTVDEYEALSEYKDKNNTDFNLPQVKTPSDFKYVPKPTYKIVKYNDPPGSVELSLGKRLYVKRQINAQGIVSPDFSMLVYPAIYYYTDSASVAADVFVIPLGEGDSNLNKILKANIAKRISEPILSTDKAISDYAAFRTLTPVDFSADGTKLLIKQKIGSREDGIWQTSIYVYDFNNKLDYDLSEVRDAISYFWQEYMNLDLEAKRWDIYPIGFDKENPDRIIVQAFAFTGEKPVFLGTWSVDWKGNQSRVVSFKKEYVPNVSMNGYKVIQDGYLSYDTVQKEEENQKKETKVMKKEAKEKYKNAVSLIDDEYKYTVKGLDDDYKDEYRDYKKLRSLSGSTEDEKLQEAYKKYLVEQAEKDLQKAEKQVEKQKKQLEKIDAKLDKLYEQTGNSSIYKGEPYVPTDEESLDELNDEPQEKVE